MTIDSDSGGYLPPPEVTESADRSASVQDLLRSISLVTAWFTAAGLLGALVWVKITPLPEFTKIVGNGTMDEEQLAKQFSANGWFLVIAVVGGLVSGLALLLVRRKTHPAVMVVLVALGGGLATLLMVQCGLAWGPGDPNLALEAAQVGDTVPVQLKVDVKGIFYAWSVASLIGAALATWLLESREKRRQPFGSEPDQYQFSG